MTGVDSAPPDAAVPSGAPSDARGRASTSELLRLGLWLGLAYGFVEAAEFMALSLVPGALSWRTGNSAYVLWVAPLFYGAAFTLASALVAVPAARIRRVPADVVLVSLLAFVGAYLAGSLQGQILSDLASAVLGLGVAAVVTRTYRGRRDEWRGLAARTLPWLLGLVALAAGGTIGWRLLSERIAMGRLPAAPPGRPNVLLLVMDTQRADHLSAYGYPRPTTPNIDRLAAEGTLFTNASATSSWTLPGHATLMTGRLLHEHRAGIMRRPYLDGRYPTIAEGLRAEGYATGGFVANTFWCGRQTGLHRGFIRYEDFYGNVGDAVARTVLGRRLAYQVLPRLGFVDVPGRKWSDDINRSLLRWVDGLGGRPFFAFVNYFDVHAPLLPPPPYAGSFSGDTASRRGSAEIDIGALTAELTLPPPEALRRMVDEYDESIRFLDAQIGDLARQLERRGILDSTLIIITSDHGESFGEHNLLYHGHSLYRDQTHVPLIARLPGRVPAGVRDSRAVGLHQVPATILAVVGADAPDFPGRSLLDDGPAEPVLSEVGKRSGVPQVWPTGQGSVASLTTERWHFIQVESGRTELYDIVRDPGEQENLAGAPEQAGLVQEFRARLASTLAGSGLPWGVR